MSKIKVVHVYGRPHGHPIHIAYSKSLNADFIHEDRILAWQNRKSSKLKRYLSWILNALFFPNRKNYDVFLTECVRPPQLIQKKLGLINSNQILISLVDDEAMYFTYSKRFPPITRKLMTSFWKNTDALICVGKYQTELAKKLLPFSHQNKIYTIFNGVSAKRVQQLRLLNPDLNSQKIVFIGNLNAPWRVFYKGIDISIKAFVKSKKEIPHLSLDIIGECSDEIKRTLLNGVPENFHNSISFLGLRHNIHKLLGQYSLYLHVARGEAWGISINEALFAGLPCLVSTETGSKEIIQKIDPSMIVEVNVEYVATAIKKYFNLSLKEKQKLSDNGRDVVNYYTEENAINMFKETFDKVVMNHLIK